MTTKNSKTTSIAKATNSEKSEGLTLKSVIEKIDEGTRLKNVFLSFDERLKGVEEFRSTMDGSGLTMNIEDSFGNQIQFNNVGMITAFVDEAIKVGKDHLASMEVDLLTMYAQA